MTARLIGAAQVSRPQSSLSTGTMKIDLFVDLNRGRSRLPWSYVDQAVDPSVVVPGRLIVVGSGSAVTVAQVIDVGIDGLVHVRPITQRA